MPWASKVDGLLSEEMEEVPDRDSLIDYITDRQPPGAIQSALTLHMKAMAQKDLIDENIKLAFPAVSEGIQMHHIYPKRWCQNNKTGKLATLLDEDKAGRDWVDSTANLMPLSRQSNLLWADRVPGQMLREKGINYEHSQAILRAAFIDKECFEYLLEATTHVEEFWQRRASLIADDLVKRMQIVI